MSDPQSLVNAMKDCDGVFSIQNYFEYGGEKEIQFGKNMLMQQKKAIFLILFITRFVEPIVIQAYHISRLKIK